MSTMTAGDRASLPIVPRQVIPLTKKKKYFSGYLAKCLLLEGQG